MVEDAQPTQKINESGGRRDRLKNIIKVAKTAGGGKLTKEELSWIRAPEVITNHPKANKIDDQLARIRQICAEKQPRIENAPQAGTGMPYETFDVVRLASVFGDKDTDIIPSSILPPNQDIQDFIDFMASSEDPVDISQQFEKLLEISKGSVIDAALTGMMASRIVARNLDKRYYPDILTTEATRDAWHENLATFVATGVPQDKLGDNYYFWTSVFTSLALRKSNASWFTQIMDKRSATVMTMSRRFAAKQASITNHAEAFAAGKSTADFLSAYIKSNIDPINASEKEEGMKILRSEDLVRLNEERRIDEISKIASTLLKGEKLIIKGDKKDFDRGFDLVEYFSAMPGIASIYKNRGKDWRDVLSEVRAMSPSVTITRSEDGVTLINEPRTDHFGSGERPSIEWIESKLEAINPRSRELVEKLIVAGAGNVDEQNVLYRGQVQPKQGDILEHLLRIEEYRREYFTDQEWQCAVDVLCACVDSGEMFFDSSSSQPVTVFMKARQDLARSVLIHPDDGLSPRLSTDLLDAVDGFDPTQASDEAKLRSLAYALDSRSWFEMHREDLAMIGSENWFVAVVLLRQNVFELLGEGGVGRRGRIKETLSSLIDRATSIQDESGGVAKKTLDAIYSIGMDYVSDPVLSSFAAMHDPSLFATAGYYLEDKGAGIRKRISNFFRDRGERRSVAYAKEIVELMDKTPDYLIKHQRSLGRRLSCPSCYSYGAGMEVQSVIQLGHTETGLRENKQNEDMGKYAEEVIRWANSKRFEEHKHN